MFLWSSCTSTQKMINQGRYDEAISKSARKLRKQNQKLKHVLSLEEAFKKATGEDMDRLLDKYESDRIEDLEHVLNIGYRVMSRQALVKPLLPLDAEKDGYQATFQFVKINQIIADLEKKLLDRYLEEGKSLIALGRNGDKRAARKAYDCFTNAKRFTDISALYDLLDTAHYYGKTRIAVDISNSSGDWMGYYIDNHLNLDVVGMNSFWTSYHLNDADGPIDYHVDAVIYSIDISPERVSEKVYKDSKEIQEGFDYVLDDNGNVLKDTLGNDVKTPRMVRINAKILEVFQEKDLIIKGNLDIFDQAGKLVDTRPFDVIERFENYSSSFRGDKRALSPASKRKLGKSPAPFPTDRSLILNALQKLSPAIHDQLRKRQWAV